MGPRVKTLHDGPAFFGQESLPVLAVCSAARHGAQQVGVDLYDLVDIVGCCRAGHIWEEEKVSDRDYRLSVSTL